jgi:AGCS family alanine or glycine:cation symporter
LILILILIKLKSREVTNIINKIVPFKCILFILVCLFGIVTNINELLLSFKIIIKDLFSLKSILSGFIIGIKRSIFMNEVMIGTTSIASGSSLVNIKEETNYQIIGVYFISIVITLLVTFLMIIYNYKNSFDTDYNLLIVNMFRYTNGYYGQLLITVIMIIFALTTILSGYYILESNITYFIKNKRIISFIKLIFLSLIASSVYLNNTFIWKYTDIVIFIMIIINSYSIIRLIGDVINDRK